MSQLKSSEEHLMNSIDSIIGIYGASGFGRDILPLVKKQYSNSHICFIDDQINGVVVNGLNSLNFDHFISLNYPDKTAVVAIANSKIRESITSKLLSNNIDLISVRGEFSHISDDVELGLSYILCPFTFIGPNVKIGKSFHANIYSYVEHDSVIEDFVTFAPGAKCNGNVHIKKHAYIGSGAVIKQGNSTKRLTIGEGAIVGMGAIVTKDVPDGVTVVGNPARILEK